MRRKRSEKPMIPVKGVRISWLMLARKADLASAAASAWMTAALSWRRASIRLFCTRSSSPKTATGLAIRVMTIRGRSLASRPMAAPHWTTAMHRTGGTRFTASRRGRA